MTNALFDYPKQSGRHSRVTDSTLTINQTIAKSKSKIRKIRVRGTWREIVANTLPAKYHGHNFLNLE